MCPLSLFNHFHFRWYRPGVLVLFINSPHTSPLSVYVLRTYPRLSTVKKIVSVFSPHHGKFIALIAAKFLLDEIEGTKVDVGGVEYRIKGYTANSLDDCILAAVHARYDGAAGIICAPILASLIERLVDVPVAIMKPEMDAVFTAVDSIAKRL